MSRERKRVGSMRMLGAVMLLGVEAPARQPGIGFLSLLQVCLVKPSLALEEIPLL